MTKYGFELGGGQASATFGARVGLAALSAALVLAAFGCSKADGDDEGDGDDGSGKGADARPDHTDLPDAPLAGVVGGKEWTFVSGFAKPAPGAGADGELWLELSERGVEGDKVCDPFLWINRKDERRVIFSTAPETGARLMDESTGESITITVRPESSDEPIRNLVGQGALDLTEVTRTRVSGKVNVSFDGDNFAKGAFSVKRCASQDGDPDDSFVADATPDPALVGAWGGPLVIIDTVTDWMWDFAFAADGTAVVQLRETTGSFIEDADETWQTDSGAEPRRLVRTVTKARVDVNGLEQEGSKEYCVYEATASKLVMDCGPSQFPAELSAPENADLVLTR
jgi:hypothetical protein